MQNILFSIANISSFSILIPALAGIFFYKRFDFKIKLFFFFILVSVFVEVLSDYFAKNRINNFPISHYYALLEYMAFSYLFYHATDSARIKIYIIYVSAIYIVFAIINVFFIEGIYTFNSNGRVAESLLLLVSALLYFFTLFKKLPKDSLLRQPMFCISCGVIFYFAGNILLFGVYNILMKNTSDSQEIWVLHSLLNILLNLLIATAFICHRKPLD